ncbi:hypothetical protein D3C86_2266320 [compost metagenome]
MLLKMDHLYRLVRSGQLIKYSGAPVLAAIIYKYNLVAVHLVLNRIRYAPMEL